MKIYFRLHRPKANIESGSDFLTKYILDYINRKLKPDPEIASTLCNPKYNFMKNYFWIVQIR